MSYYAAMGGGLGTSQHFTHLSEEQLKHMSRHVRDVVPETAGPDVIKAPLTVHSRVEAAFNNVVHAAASAGRSASYRVAAWNTLCAFLERCSQQDDDDLRISVWTKGWWSRVFHVYLAQAQSARPKSARQLLTTLTTLADRTARDPMLEGVIIDACRCLLEPLVGGDDHGRVKICALALAHFLGKGVMCLDMVMRQYRKILYSHSTHSGTSDQTCFEGFLSDLFRWMGRVDFGSTIAKLVSTLLDKAQHSNMLQKTTTNSTGTPAWTAALVQATRGNAIAVPMLRAHLLPTLFKRSASDYAVFLDTIGLRTFLDLSGGSTAPDSRLNLKLLCASLQAGEDLGLLRETEDSHLLYESDIMYFPVRMIARLLQHDSRTARLTALSLLITSHSATRPVLRTSFRAIKRNLSHLLADTDANFRGEVFSLVQRLIDRVRAITAALARQTGNTDDPTQRRTHQPVEVLCYHVKFLEWLLPFLQWELRPTASYQQHISALSCTLIVARSGLDDAVNVDSLSKSALGETRWPFMTRVLTPDVRRLLLDLIVDPFDDVRQTAAAILSLYSRDDSDGLCQTRLALGRAEAAMLASGRADQADGVAHLYKLLHRYHENDGSELSQLVARLEQMTEIAQGDLGRAVDRYPVHGLLTSLRYVLENDHQAVGDDTILWRLVGCLGVIWQVVKPVLCNDAPEGFVVEEAADAAVIASKDTLSYCWRALKESSMLLSTLLRKLSAADSEQMQQLCELCFTQLAELRHRGAFSTVAQTWITCCTASRELCATDGQLISHYWYRRITSILRTKTTINTRRSAGLPSLLCGLLIVERDGELLKQAFADLEAIAREPASSDTRQEGSLPQVHAMNCLKDVLKNSRLGEASEPYLAVALKLAADALRSAAWAVRNCGLMLFRAVLDRLLGTSDASPDEDVNVEKRLSVEQYPKLLEMVLELLPHSTAEPKDALRAPVNNECVFPALHLLQRLTVPEDRLDSIRRSVVELMASPAWHVRDKAARTYASFVIEAQAQDELHRLLQTGTLSQNALHGALLCAKHIVAKLSARPATSSVFSSEILRDVESRADELYHSNECAVTQAAYIDVLSVCMDSIMQHSLECKAPGQADIYIHLNITRVSTELRRYTLANGPTAGFGQALARLLVYQSLFTSEMDSSLRQEALSTIADLSQQDADGCIVFLEKTTAMLRRGHRLTSEALSVVLSICSDIEGLSGVDIRLKCEVLALLLRIMDTRCCNGVEHSALWTLARSMTERGNQRCIDVRLQWQATCIENMARTPELADSPPAYDVRLWADICIAAVQNERLYSRDAVATAIARLSSLWSVLAATDVLDKQMLGLCIAVYDLLNDDDEDIRVLASTAACRILALSGGTAPSDGIVPAVASQRLLAFMFRKWSTDHGFVCKAMARAFGAQYVDEHSVAAELEASTATDTALFVEEKQNLYIDEAQEVKAWCRVVAHLPTKALPKENVKQMSRWVTKGLDVLSGKVLDYEDGPLGWTSKPELFTLGLQVIHGAQLLLLLSNARTRVSVRPSALRRQLAHLAYDRGLSEPYSLWRREIEGVLADAVASKLRAVHAMLLHMATDT